MRRGTLAVLLGLLCCAAWPSAAPTVEAQRGRMYIDGTVIGISGRAVSRSRPFRVIVNSFTSEGEARSLNEALESGGQDRLLDELRRLNAGRVSVGGGVGVRANAIIRTPTDDGGTRLQVIYERTVNFFELRHGTRSQDYRFGYAEIFLDRRGRGQGTFIPAARIRMRDDGTWEVIDFGVYPARIIGVRATCSVPAR